MARGKSKEEAHPDRLGCVAFCISLELSARIQLHSILYEFRAVSKDSAVQHLYEFGSISKDSAT